MRGKKVIQRQPNKGERKAWSRSQAQWERRPLNLKKKHRFADGLLAGKDKQLASGGEAYTKNNTSWQNFLWRANLIQDSLIYQKRTLHNTPPTDKDTLTLYVKFKSNEFGVPLLDVHDDEVLDRWGEVILCTGEWKSPACVKLFYTFISAVHKKKGHDEGYKSACLACVDIADSCIKRGKKVPAKGCTKHPSKIQHRNVGNPTMSEDAKAEKTFWTPSTYVPQSSASMFPLELLLVRNYLLTSIPSLSSFTLWIKILIGVILFLRCDDIIHLYVEDIIMSMTVLTQHSDGSLSVAGIGVRFLGKNQTTYTYLMLWATPSHPHFCPVTNLLLWLHLNKEKVGSTGPMFDSDNYPKTYEDDGTRVEAFSKSLYNENRKSLLDALGKSIERTACWGMHSLRRTGYVMGIWGLGQLEYMMLAARHATLKTTQRYIGSSPTDFAHAKKANLETALAAAPLWESSYVRDLQQFDAAMPARATLNQYCGMAPGVTVSIAMLADAFTEKELVVPSDPTAPLSYLNAHEAIDSYTGSKVQKQSEELEAYAAYIPEHKREDFKSCVGRQCNQAVLSATRMRASRVENDVEGAEEEEGVSTVSLGKRPLAEVEVVAGSKRRKKLEWDVPGRADTISRTKNTKERLAAVLRIGADAERDMPRQCKRSQGLRGFFNRTVLPIRDCLANCYKDEENAEAAFIARHTATSGNLRGNFAVSNFTNQCVAACPTRPRK